MGLLLFSCDQLQGHRWSHFLGCYFPAPFNAESVFGSFTSTRTILVASLNEIPNLSLAEFLANHDRILLVHLHDAGVDLLASCALASPTVCEAKSRAMLTAAANRTPEARRDFALLRIK